MTTMTTTITNAIRIFVAVLSLLVAFNATAQEDRIWESLGPRVITGSNEIIGITDREVIGAVNSVAPHPSNADIMFIGAVNGGVWRTTNATNSSPNWDDVSDDLPSLSIGAVAYDLGDASFQTVLVGAGRYSSNARRGSTRFGIYRTTNNGGNWVDIDSTALDGQSINAISANGNLVLASTGGSVSGQGLFLGQNVGGTWQWTQLSGRTPPGATAPILPTGKTFDLVADPTTANRYYTMNQSGVYRVTLPAATPENAAWTRVSTTAMNGQLSGAAHGHLAIGPGGEVFVAMNTSGTVLSNFWRSADGSTGWQSLDTPITSPWGNWFLALAADPANGNIAYVGGGGRESEYRVNASLASGSQTARITRAGTSSDSRPHADARNMSFDAYGDLIEVNDGGVYKQTNPANATGDWFSMNGNLIATEYIDLAWDSVSHVAMGGAIDNGTSIQNGFVRDRWLHIHGGDGGDAAINDTGSAIQSQRYTSSQRLGGFTRRTYDQNNSQLATNAVPMTPPACAGGTPCFTPTWPFVAPVAVNVVNPVRIVVGGSNGVFESTDQGQNSVQLLDGTGTAVPGVNASGSSDPIAAGANGNADALYVGILDDVWVRTAGGFGSALTQTDPSATRNNAIVDVVIDPSNDQYAFAIDSGNAVFWTSNAGTNWTNITGNFGTATTAAVRSIAYSTSNINGAVIVGTDNGVFIARGDGSSVNDAGGNPIPFTNWTALGVGLPSAPVYDLEYDPADEVLAAGTFGRGAWALNMEERDPIDVALVLDKSGSMGDPACSGCENKMVVLQDAAELFIQTWQMLSDADDRIAATFFDSSVDTFSASGNQLVTLTGSGNDVISYIRSKSDGGWTAMGGGTQTAINLLTDVSRPRSIIIFTDGMQNRDPMIELNSGVYEIRDTGRPSSGVSPTTPPTQLNGALDITVNTIGVGVTSAYDAQLSAISSGTTGLHKSTTNADADLRRFYIEQLVDTLRDASPQLVDYRYAKIGADSTGAESIGINVGAKKVVLSISWDRRDTENLSVAVFKDGKNVTKLAKERRRGNFYDVLSFDTSSHQKAAGTDAALLSDGEWEVRVEGPDNMDYEVAALADHSLLDYEFETTPRVLQAGDTTVLAGEIQLNGLPYGDDVSVRVEIQIPKQSIATALALTPTPSGIKPKDEETLAEAKLRHLLLHSANFRDQISKRRTSKTLMRTASGRFSAPFTETSVAGTYKVSFLLAGSGPQVGEFVRREERFFVIAPGPFVRDSSAIQTSDVKTVDGKTTITIRIRPQDIHGNYLGADLKNDISAIIPGTGDTAVVTDIGNGWYELVLTSNEIKPDIQISIGDTVVATDKPNEIDVKERPPIVTERPSAEPSPVDNLCWLWLLLAIILSVVVVLLVKKRWSNS